jgi:hypothetical protein
MTIADKKKLALNYVQLGYPIEDALLHVKLTPTQIDNALADPKYQEQVQEVLRQEEIELLEDYRMTVKAAALDSKKKDYRGIKDRLEIINSDRYKKDKKQDPIASNFTININRHRGKAK